MVSLWFLGLKVPKRLGSFSTVSSRTISILGNLKPSKGSTHNSVRLGRGPSSGRGKTSGRGQKGQKARGHVKSWFEGGQTPIYKLFPKIGFTNVHSEKLNILSLNRLVWFHRKGRLQLKPDEVLTMKKMKDFGLVTGSIKHGVKILANGKSGFKLPIKIEATSASQEAIKAIESAGGEFTARYFDRLGLRAHLAPTWFLRKRGRLPLPARPIKRKHIEFYSNMEKRGYLVKEQHPLLKQIQDARIKGVNSSVKKTKKKSTLELQLENLDSSLASANAPLINQSSIKKL